MDPPSVEGISVDPPMVKTVKNRVRPINATEARSFLSLAGHCYQLFKIIPLMAHVTRLTRKSVEFM